MNAPTISVIIPMYNSENTIINSLRSVLDQTYENILEIIVINDGSTDTSKALVEQFNKKNPGSGLILIDIPNKGVSSARNAGLRVARGQWIALLDSDDEWLPNKLERQIAILSDHPEIDFLGCNRNSEKFKRVFFKKVGHLTRISPSLLLYKFLFVTPSVIFKKEILSDVGYFDEQQDHAEEGNYFIRICNKYNCYLLNESLVITGDGKANFGEKGLSSHLWEMEKGELSNIKMSYNNKIIGPVELCFLALFSLTKYIRRVLIVAYRGL